MDQFAEACGVRGRGAAPRLPIVGVASDPDPGRPGSRRLPHGVAATPRSVGVQRSPGAVRCRRRVARRDRSRHPQPARRDARTASIGRARRSRRSPHAGHGTSSPKTRASTGRSTPWPPAIMPRSARCSRPATPRCATDFEVSSPELDAMVEVARAVARGHRRADDRRRVRRMHDQPRATRRRRRRSRRRRAATTRRGPGSHSDGPAGPGNGRAPGGSPDMRAVQTPSRHDVGASLGRGAVRLPAAEPPAPAAAARTQPITVGWFAIIVFAFLAGLGAIAARRDRWRLRRIGIGSELPSPPQLTNYVLPQETVIFDRRGTRELARFGDARREVVTFEEIPPLVLDATTAIEDKTFWENAGFDPLAIVAAGLDSLRGNSRGASTITQQLVRQRAPARRRSSRTRSGRSSASSRKSSSRSASPRPSKSATARRASARSSPPTSTRTTTATSCTGSRPPRRAISASTLEELTPAQAAILAGLPQSPSNHDLVRNVTERCAVEVEEDAACPAGESELIVP